MKRLMPVLSVLVVATLFVVACEDSQLPTMVDSESISLAISDGAHPTDSSNAEFFFLPGIVPNPSDHPDYDEDDFNPYLAPKLRICELNPEISGEVAKCAAGVDLVVDGEVMGINADETHYSFGWKTGEGMTVSGTDYRISVYIGLGIEEVPLGYRDVRAVDSPGQVPSHPETFEYYVFNNGSNIPIKVRIESGALCDVPRNKDCVTRFVDLDDGGDLALMTGDDIYGHLHVPSQASSDQTNPTLNMKPCTQPSDLPIDIPTFGACFEIDDFGSGVKLGVDDPATISVCTIVEDPGFQLLDHQQQHLVTLHRWHDGVVEALPHVEDNCTPPQPPVPTDVVGYARAGLGLLRAGVSALLVPKPLHAKAVVLHRGMGGSTTMFSSFQFALPAKMEKIPAGDGQIARVGTTVAIAPSVMVTDLFNDPVENARVWFTIDSTDLRGAKLETVYPAFTDTAGIASVQTWTLGSDVGEYSLDASGFGFAVDGSSEEFNGPRVEIVDGETLPVLDPYVPLHDEWDDGVEDGPKVALRQGTVTFTATACEAGYGTPGFIDGKMDDGEWQCADSTTVPVNLSGGSTTDATLYWMNDGTDLFFAVKVPRSSADKVNVLQVSFDNNNSFNESSTGIAEEFDDILVYDASEGLTDRFLTERCTGSKQAACGRDDVRGTDGSNDGDGAFFNDGFYSVYELSHPLSGDDHDISVSSGGDDMVGIFLTLSLGKGAQGNTQWPGFREFFEIVIR